MIKSKEDGFMTESVQKKSSKLLTLSLLIISGAHMVSHVFGSIHNALFPVFREEFSLSLQQLGLIAAIPPLCQVFSYIPSGLVADKFGQKTLIIASFLIAGTAAIGLGLSTNVVTLIIFLSILTTAITIYHPPAYSLTSELFPKEVRGRALGIHGAGGTIGMALGPISLSIFLGVLLWDWRRIYIFWAIPILVYILAILKLETSDKKEVKNEQVAKKVGEDSSVKETGGLLSMGLIGFMLFQGVRNMGRNIIMTFIPTYMHDNIGLTVAEAGFIYGAASLTGIIAAPAGGYIADRLGDKKWLMIAIGSYAFTLFLASLTRNSLMFTILYWAGGFCTASSMAAASSIIARSTPSGRRGLGFAMYFLPGSLVRTISPIIGANIAASFGLWSIFPISIALIILSMVLLRIGVS
jgi:MFS family permease